MSAPLRRSGWSRPRMLISSAASWSWRRWRRRLSAGGVSALTQPATVHGLGGVGKTQLALYFAARHFARYTAGFWLPAENPTALAVAFADLARVLQLPEADDPDQRRRTEAVKRWLALPSSGLWLLIFDNAERGEDVAPYLPAGRRGHVLITSRNPEWRPLAKALKVRTLPREKSVELLCQGMEGADEQVAAALAKELGDLPLALAQAAAYVRDTACGFGYYLGKFRERWTEFDAEQEAERGYGRTVAVTLGMALDRLREQNDEAAEEVLHRCAFLAPDSIPRELLTGEEIDERAVGRAITVLRRYSLVETAPGLVSLHRLVQRAVRERLSEQERATQSRGALRSCFRRFLDPNDYRTWDGCRAVLTHALQAVEHAEALGEAAVMRSWLLDRVGTYLRQTGELAEARRCLERALRNEAKAHGAVHEIVALLGQIVPAFRDLRAPAEARRPEFGIWNLRALAEARRGAPGTAAEARRCLARSPLGRSLGGMDGHAATEVSRWLERPLCQDVKVPAPKPENLALAPYDIAITHDTLGLVLRDLGELAEARNCVERALHLKELAYGPEHPQVAITLDNLGLVLQDLGDSAAARSCHERALQLKEKAYGPEHAEVAITLYGNLGLVLADLGESVAGARAAARSEPLQLKEKAYGRGPPRGRHHARQPRASAPRPGGDDLRPRGPWSRGLRIDEKLFGTRSPLPRHHDGVPRRHRPALKETSPESRSASRTRPSGDRAWLRHARPCAPWPASSADLGLVARDEGHSAEARTKLERALSIVRARLGSDEHHETARIRKLLQSVPDLLQTPHHQRFPKHRPSSSFSLSAVPLGRSRPQHQGRNPGDSQEDRRLRDRRSVSSSSRKPTFGSTHSPAC